MMDGQRGQHEQKTRKYHDPRAYAVPVFPLREGPGPDLTGVVRPVDGS